MKNRNRMRFGEKRKEKRKKSNDVIRRITFFKSVVVIVEALFYLQFLLFIHDFVFMGVREKFFLV